MSTFSDRVVFRTFAGFGEGHFPGFQLALGLLEQAYQTNLLQIDRRLNNLSILLLVILAPVGSPLHEAAFVELQARNLSELQVADALAQATPLALNDLHYLAYVRQPRQQSLLQTVYRIHYFPSLVEFMTRCALVERHVAEAFAKTIPFRVFPQVQPPFPHALKPAMLSEGYLVRLYAEVLESDWPVVSRWPSARPSWETKLPADERRFLDCALGLPVDRRALLYLSFYGNLNVRTLTEVIQEAWDPSCEVADVLLELERAWRSVVTCSVRKQSGNW